MSLENPCEFIKKIHENPFAKIMDLTERDLIMLREHLTVCKECAKLVDEVWAKYEDMMPIDPNINDGRWN
jgi:hypothetical protein